MDDPDVTKQFLARLNTKRAARTMSQTESEPLAVASYRQAAAVLDRFRPDDLRPLESHAVDSYPRTLLYDDVIPAAGERASGLYTLRPEVRAKALKQLGSRENMWKALAANPRRVQTPLQAMWESYLASGRLPDLDSAKYSDLILMDQIITWMRGIDDSLPSPETISARTREKSVLASFEHLVSSEFTGRTKELQRLREHVRALPPATGLDAVKRQLETWAGMKQEPILMISGPGGIGKSALIGRMLWEHAHVSKEARIPFAYLAFDSTVLRVQTPFKLLVEAAAQLELQYPEFAEGFAVFHQEVRSFRDTRGRFRTRELTLDSREARIEGAHAASRQLYQSFGELLQAICGRGETKKPILLVFDTFEEVQYRDQESLWEFWGMLDAIASVYPPFRVVISGRTPVTDYSLKASGLVHLALPELDGKDRVILLQRLGVGSEPIAKAVAEQVGGNPLSLRLAAGLVAKEMERVGAGGIEGLTTRRFLLFRVDEQLIQGQLYRRLLDHIHNADVRKLAHPGMILRRITPDIILKVLGPLYLQHIDSMEEADVLFAELRKEHALVRVAEGNALEYRPDIRRAMIRLLEQDKFQEVRGLHRKAIDYYQGFDDPISRAEELYHRLVLGENEPWELSERWKDGVGPSLASSLDEYPDRSKAWLASRMSIEVPRSVYAGADLAEWERNTTRKVQVALTSLDHGRALELLGEREDRSEASPLFALETKAHILRGDYQAAGAAAEKGIDHVSRSTNRGRLAELLWLQSQIRLLNGEPPASAEESLQRAKCAVEHSSDPVALIHIQSHRLLLRQVYPGNYEPNAPALRIALNEACARLTDDNAYSVPYVMHLAAQLLGGEFPQTVSRLRAFIHGDFKFTPEVLTGENLQGLEGYREPWESIDISPETMA